MSSTIQTQKYVGMAGGAAILLFVAYVIWDWAFNHREYYIGRFLLTATVEVDGELKSGSSVYEVSYNARRRGGGFGSSPINGARGTMPMIDLGKNGVLFLSFSQGGAHIPGSLVATNPPKCISTTPARLPTQVMSGVNKGYDFRKRLNKMQNAKGVFIAGKRSLSISIIKDNKFEKAIEFCNLALYSSNKIKPISITIEHTDLPMDKINPYQNSLANRPWRNEFYND